MTLNEIGKGAYASILELVDALCDAGDDNDTARERIEQDVLSVRVRSDWRNVGEAPGEPVEYEILITTGGPAVRIVGDFNDYCEPISATLQVQDWGTPWTDYRDANEDVLLDYARCFYFGE